MEGYCTPTNGGLLHSNEWRVIALQRMEGYCTPTNGGLLHSNEWRAKLCEEHFSLRPEFPKQRHHTFLIQYSYSFLVLSKTSTSIAPLDGKHWNHLGVRLCSCLYSTTSYPAIQNLSKFPNGRRPIGWLYDAILVMKVASTDVQVGFVSNLLSSEFPPILIETWNTEKLCNLLVRLRRLLLEKGSLLWKLETFGILVNSLASSKPSLNCVEKDFYFYSMHQVDGDFLVDQIDGFVLPDSCSHLKELAFLALLTCISGRYSDVQDLTRAKSAQARQAPLKAKRWNGGIVVSGDAVIFLNFDLSSSQSSKLKFLAVGGISIATMTTS
ncbi:10570_t:CDS:2 [Ambispora leptoticha]|uniref:10570_t:CDS:1 n=1 Tax=Ambispora leptoticha TaxID=144679 RepID=A0A9N9BPM9_9GLOM|nr:10570_t:CDS:2 [Ambispora leptoticha]